MAVHHDLQARLALDRFPRSSAYDQQWVVDNTMGPHPLWLLEWLVETVDLRPGMRVLDLGCGTGLTSVYLAREHGVRVVAADLWVDPSENARRLEQAGVDDLVTPLRVEAHDLPFARGWFDAVVSVDAYQYFGTDDLYLGRLVPFLREGGVLGVVSPGTREDLVDVPAHLQPFWESDFACFHSPTWWRRHWEHTGLVDVETADWLHDGWRQWQLWNEACLDHADDAWLQRWRDITLGQVEMLRLDAGRTLGFTRAVARRRAGTR